DGTYEQMGQDLGALAALIGRSPDLRQSLENPIFALSQRKAVLSEVARRLGLQAAVKNFLLLLMDRGRIGQLPDIVRELGQLIDRQAGRVRAQLTSARPVSEEMATALRTAMERRLGKQVLLERREDPALLGGIVAKVGDVLYDGSVRTQLELAREELL